jgi:hypothetical protein
MPANVSCEANPCIHCDLAKNCRAETIEVDEEGTCLTYNEGDSEED